MIGTSIGKYRIVGLLGRGAAGIVYRAIDDTLDREVAIKVLNPRVAASGVMKRFRAEATTLAKLSHPEIATIYELLQTDTDLLMVMELVRGETLEMLSARVGPMSPDLAGRLLDGILSALEHAHRCGIVHRDLKPANVMVTELGGVKIMDFGIARVRGAEHMTMDGGAIGTPAYMAPEQVLGQEIDGRADLYAVGMILYRLLAGTLPFTADAPMLLLLQKHVAETPAPLRSHREGLPDWCETVVQRALAKSPAARFQTAGDFRAAVARASGLAPSIDLAKALKIPAHDTAAPAAAPPPMQTVTIVPGGPAAAAGRLKPVASARQGAAIFAGLVTLGLVAYWINASAIQARAARKPGNPAVEAGAPRNAPREAAPSRRAPDRGASTNDTAAAATLPPLVFQAKVLIGRGDEQREEGARLSLARGRVSVTPYAAPDDPVFSEPYGDITAIRYSRESSRRALPAIRLGDRVIRLGDDVLGVAGSRERHQITLQTGVDDRVVTVRVDQRVVSRLLDALKERTGRDPQVVSRR